MSTKVWLLALLIFVPKLSDGQVTDCNLAAIDLVFVLDASGSVGATNFDMILTFVRDIVTSLEIGPDEGQVAVIRFASTASVIFGLTANDNEADLLNAVNSVTFTRGGTNIAAALNLLVSSGFIGARPESQGVPRFAVVVTDGESNLGTTTAAAAAVRAVVPEITCFAVGIGANINLAELEQIASTPTTTFLRTISGFNADELENLTRILRLEACQATVILTIGEKVEREIGQGQVAFFRYQVPAQGFSIQVTVGMGQFAICGSTTIEQPSCGDPSLHDWRREVTGFVDVYITPDGLDADSLPVGRPRPTAVPPNLQIFVTVEGLNMNNDFCLNTTFGDTRIPRVPPVGMGGDPHFSVVLPDNHLLCYTVQGECGSVYNLISNKNFHMNALFVPNYGERNATWIGALGVVIGNSQQLSNVTKIKINATSKNICVGDGITLTAKNVQELHLKHGELLSSIPNTQKHSGNPRVKVILEDLGLQFIVRFTQKHLEVFWQSMETLSKDSHGLIGQFLRDGVRIDHIQKVLIFHDKKPVPVKQRSVWGYMKHELHEEADGKQCWATINHGNQGEGLIDGTYVNYQVKDILSTDFLFKPNKHTLK